MKNVKTKVAPFRLGLPLRDKRFFKLSERDMSRTVGVSVTVPDEALTIREIMLKHTAGMNVATALAKQPMYVNGSLDDEDLEEVMRLDLSDRADRLREISERNAIALSTAEAAVARARETKKQLDKAKESAAGAPDPDATSSSGKSTAKTKNEDDAKK